MNKPEEIQVLLTAPLLQMFDVAKATPPPLPFPINRNLNIYHRKYKHIELVKQHLALLTLPQLFGYFLLSASCLLSVMPFFLPNIL